MWPLMGGLFTGHKSDLFYFRKRGDPFIKPPAFLFLNVSPPCLSDSPTQQLFLPLSTLSPSHPGALHPCPLVHTPPPHPPFVQCGGPLSYCCGAFGRETPVCTGGSSPTVCERRTNGNGQKRRGLAEGTGCTNEHCQDLKAEEFFSCLFSSCLS